MMNIGAVKADIKSSEMLSDRRLHDALKQYFLFDPQYYLKKHLLNLPIQDAQKHFLEIGMFENMQPSPYFNPNEYLLENIDVASSKINPFYHFVVWGHTEVRCTTKYFRFDGRIIRTRADAIAELFEEAKVFDAVWYKKRHPEVADENVSPIKHYITFGMKKGYSPNVIFDPQYYGSQAPGSAINGWNHLLHYLLVGTILDLNPHPLFDASWYRNKYAVDEPKISTLTHFRTIGREGGYDPNSLFNVKHYIIQFPEAAVWPGGPVGHYIERGHLEDTTSSEAFDAPHFERTRGGAESGDLNPQVHCETIGQANKSDWGSPAVEVAAQAIGRLPFSIESELIAALRDPLIFDLSFYRHAYKIKGSDAAVVIDFLLHPTRRASPYFDPAWYLEQNPEVGPEGFAPLLHYLTTGRRGGRRPSQFFDGKQIDIPHELATRIIEESGLFDSKWYLHKHADVARAGVDPLQHYAFGGHREKNRSPNAMFDASWYASQSPDLREYGWNPLVHYILLGASKSLTTHPLFDSRWVENATGDEIPETRLGILLGKATSDGIGPNEFFDPQFYLKRHPESGRYPGGVFGHFIEVGWKEGFDPSERFSTEGYLRANRDVQERGTNPLVHFILSGRAEGRNPRPAPLSAPLERFSESEYGATGPLLSFDAETKLPEGFTLSIAVHLHLYYVDMAEEFCRYLQNIPTTFHLFVSVPPGRGDLEKVSATFALHLPNCSLVTVRSPVNRGRDVAPFLVEFGEELLKFDLVLHMHSKRSPHSSQHADWRRYLLHYAIGNRSIVNQILTAFCADPRMGLFQPPYHPRVRAQPKWGDNRNAASKLLLRMGLSYVGDTCPDFPAGSFFWARVEALRPLFDGRLQLGDFEEEDGQIDGTTAHALERLFGILPVLRGYTTACRYIDVAHNLTNYYGKSRAFRGFERDRTDDISRYQAAVRARLGKRGRIAVVTAIIGPFDALLLPEYLEAEIDYFCVSDSVVDGYGVFRLSSPPYIDADPRRTARYIKTNLLRLFPGYEFVVWVDANVLLRTPVTKFVTATEASGCGVGAIPHPIRRSYLDEAAIAIELALDDADIIKVQLKKYEEVADLESADLIETNFMVFDTRIPVVHEFMRIWWNEINTYSRRDQVSINFALIKAGANWHPLLPEYLSVRDAPEFALFRHGLNEWGPKPSIYAAWHKPSANDGYLLPLPEIHLYSKQAELLDLDVVVCVHNALEDVRTCLASVEAARDRRGGLIIVDDASETETAPFLQKFAASTDATIVRHDVRQGYTKAANAGVRVSTAKNILLLNSDTIVPRKALDKFADALDREPLLGIVGPLSNAASWQSVPSTDGTPGQTAVNQLPLGMSVSDMDLSFERRWDGRVIRTPLVHGFCFCVKRAVFDVVGLFDEENFPRGYGEENDFCFRASDAGFDLGVLTNTYIFHSKSKSYAEGERTQLMNDGMTALIRKATKSRIVRAVETMRNQPALVAAREASAALFETSASTLFPAALNEANQRQVGKRGRLFLLPSRRSDGLPAGSGFVRVLQPYKSHAVAREWDVVELRNGELPSLTSSDTILVQREGSGIESAAMQAWIGTILQSGARLVYEVDDDLFDGSALRKRGFRGNTEDLANRVLHLARSAHCVTVSSRALKTKLGMHNRNVVLVPNALDADLWQMRGKAPRALDPAVSSDGRRVRIGYVGTPTHDQDLALVAEVITGLQERYPGRLDVQVIGGFGQKKNIFGSVISLPTANDYPTFVRWLRTNMCWDIGIIPLASNSFNANKSYLKFLECGALGMALICSRNPEYSTVVRHGENGLLVANDAAEWDAALTKLITDPHERRRLARTAYDEISQIHLLDHLAETLLHVVAPAS